MTDEERNIAKREARRSRKKKLLIRRVTAIAVLFVLVTGVVFGVIKLVGAIASSVKAAPAVVTEIGPVLPNSEATVPPLLSAYDYSSPVPETPVQGSLSSALLIGDSRVAVYSVYGDVVPSGLDVAYNESVSVTSAEERSFTLGDGSSLTLAEIMTKKNYSSVYLEFGLNELGWEYSSAFGDGYTELVSRVRELAPSADIYLVSIIPVSASQSSASDYINNEKVAQYNGIIAEAARNLSAYYIDVTTAFAPESSLADSFNAGNGIGLSKAGASLLINQLETHIVNKENYA